MSTNEKFNEATRVQMPALVHLTRYYKVLVCKKNS